MSKFVHLHVHSQYSILDGQASIQRLVDKAMADGQPGIAVTDHGDMFGIKEFYNYVKKQNGKKHDKIKTLKKLSAGLEKLLAEGSDPAARLRQLKEELAALEGRKNDSPEDAEACAAARARVEEVESMQKEFGFDPAAAQEKIAGLEAVPDFKPIIGCRAAAPSGQGGQAGPERLPPDPAGQEPQGIPQPHQDRLEGVDRRFLHASAYRPQ